MKRREFLAAAAVAPFSFALWPKQNLGRPVFKVIDYSLTARDEFGWIYRRVLIHPDVAPVMVKNAKYCWGALLVTVHNFELEQYGEAFRQDAQRFIASKTYQGHNDDKTMWGIIKKNDWKIVQYDGCGQELATLTEKDFRDYKGYIQCKP